MSETAEQGTDSTGFPTPSSLLTFLIADVRGYTRFTTERGDEAAARLADRFAALCEEVLGQHEGRVIELRGDEALCVFSSARSALHGAVALQARLTEAMAADPSLPLTVGMGLDAGEAIPVRGGYRGGALNLAARLCSIAGGGEILASEGVIHLARKTEGLVFVDRGQVTLKGLAAPVRVLQIAPEGELPAVLPPLQPILVTHPTNLPDDSTPFIGREGEIVAVAGLVRDPHIRLVTLTGPGGTGKTRLALQVGNTLLYDFTDGVFFCDLSSLTDVSLVPSTIARVLGAKEQGGALPVESITEHLRDRHLLLVLDNFEHLIDTSPLIATLLDACRDLHILVTSRIPLHLSREHEHAVPPLSVPDLEGVQNAASLSRYESVALFTQRARAVKDNFTVTDESAPAVAEICARLDGLPLAIELAAARIKLFPPQALLQRVEKRLALLTGGARDKPTRQQTLRGAIDWSYSLLTEEEQRLFARLSVFAGGCSFEAAEALCNPEGGIDLLEGMSSLVDKSLIKQEGEEEARFSMLETIREYAMEKLNQREEADGIRGRHAEFFLALARSANLTNEDEGEQRHYLIIRDGDNVRAALEWARGSGNIELALRIATALENYWVTNSPLEGKHWLEDLLKLSADVPDDLRALALRACAGATTILGDFDEGEKYSEASLALYRQLGDERGIGIMYHRLAGPYLSRGDLEKGRALVQESLRLHRKINFKKGEAQGLTFLAHVELIEGNEERAFQLFEQSAAISAEVGFVWWHASMLLQISEFLLRRGRPREAEPHLLRALPLVRHMNDRRGSILTLAMLAWLAAETGRQDRAGRLWGAIEREESRGQVGQWEAQRDEFARFVFAQAGPEFESARQGGRHLSLSDAVDEVLQSAH